MLKGKWLVLFTILFCSFAIPDGIMTIVEAEHVPANWDDMELHKWYDLVPVIQKTKIVECDIKDNSTQVIILLPPGMQTSCSQVSTSSSDNWGSGNGSEEVIIFLPEMISRKS